MVDASTCALQIGLGITNNSPPPNFSYHISLLIFQSATQCTNSGFHAISIIVLKCLLCDNAFVNVYVASDGKEKYEVIIKHFLHHIHVSLLGKHHGILDA